MEENKKLAEAKAEEEVLRQQEQERLSIGAPNLGDESSPDRDEL